jgi:fumarate reductase (CoM/CoB) subunit A
VYEVDTDVLIIGTGGAGLYAAIKAAERDVDVTIWDKGLVGRSGSTVGGAGVASVGKWSQAADGPETFFRDTVTAGSYLNDQPLVRILAEESGNRIEEMEDWGLNFDREPDGDYVLDEAGGHSFPRLLAISDRVGLQMTKVLRAQVTKRDVTQFADVVATELVTTNGRIAGARGIDLERGELQSVNSPSVVLATGGLGQLYPNTSNPVQCTGDGIALAYRAGAKVMNMEQVQFYPSGMVDPPSLQGFILGIQEYSKLFNTENERFMERYQPEKLESTTRDRLARAIQAEIDEGRGTEHGGVFLDATELSDDEYRSFQHEMEIAAERGYDLRGERVEVAPSAHYFMGGVEINENGETSLPGLFAAGEVSAGVQGGNRLSGNSLAGIAVFGARAGERAARYARDLSEVRSGGKSIKGSESLTRLPGSNTGSTTPEEAKDELRDIMAEGAGVTRDEDGLNNALTEIMELKNRLIEDIQVNRESLLHNYGVASYLELENMLTVAELIAHSALERRESLGAHYREDYRELNDPKVRDCIEIFIEDGERCLERRNAVMDEMQPGEVD